MEDSIAVYWITLRIHLSGPKFLIDNFFPEYFLLLLLKIMIDNLIRRHPEMSWSILCVQLRYTTSVVHLF